MTLLTPLLFLTLASTPTPTEREPGSLKAVAFNVLYNSEEIDASIDFVEKADADLVCLRELTPRFAKAFERRLAKRYPHLKLFAREGSWGAGFASKFPLSDVRLFPEKPHRIPALEARVATPQGSMRAVCVHLFPPVGKRKKSEGFFEMMEKNAELRHSQAEALVSRYARERGPLLLLGDMNEEQDGAAMATFRRAGYSSSCRLPQARCGPTFPGASSVLPAIWEIDHVLGKRIRFHSAEVVKEGGSDHFPVAATFTLEPS